MATIRLPADFRDFLKLLNSNRVDYLLIGGYAVCYHGYYRNTNDIDIWIDVSPENAQRITKTIRDFGFQQTELTESLFLEKGQMIRMGMEPTRIEILTEISACDFAACIARAIDGELDGIPVPIISLSDLLKNKLKSGRLKDLDDAQKLRD